GFVVKIGYRDLRAECPKSLRATPRNRFVIGNANDETFFSFQELGLHRRKHRFSVLVHVSLHVTFRNQLDCTEGLAAIFRIVDVRDFPTVDLELTLTPGGNFRFQPIFANGSDKLLQGRAFADGQCVVRFPLEHSRHFPSEYCRKRGTFRPGKMAASQKRRTESNECGPNVVHAPETSQFFMRKSDGLFSRTNVRGDMRAISSDRSNSVIVRLTVSMVSPR